MFKRWRIIGRLFPYMRPYKGRAIALVVLTVLGALFALIQPWPLAFLIEGILREGGGAPDYPSYLSFMEDWSETAQILFPVLLGFSFVLISNGMLVLLRAVDSRLELGMVLDFRSDLFRHIQKLSFQYHDQGAAGRFIYQINQIAHDAGSIPTSMLPLAEAVLTVIGMFTVTYLLHPTLALAAAAAVPFVLLSTRMYSSRIEPMLYRARELEGDSMNIVHEKISIVRVVVAFCRERYEHDRFRAQGEQALGSRVKVTVAQTAFGLVVAVLTAAGTAVVLFVGARAVRNGSLRLSELTIVLAYVAAVYRPLEEISKTFAHLQQQLIHMEMVMNVLDAVPEVQERPRAVALQNVRGRIEVRDVSFHYNTRQRTLEHIDFVVEPGEFVAVVGPTGAGKSTLVSLLPRFFDPQSGAVLIDGHDVRDLTLESLRQSIGLVMQEPILFAGTIADNIRYGRLEASDDEVVAAAKAANCHDFIVSLPEGYQTTVGERGARISGGERQRIAVARTFLKDAPILILDEPTSSIDSRTEGVILEALERLAEGRTTIMIAHRLSTVRLADRIIVMNDGMVVEQGTHDDLLAAGGMYAELWGAQMGDGAKVAAAPPPTEQPAAPALPAPSANTVPVLPPPSSALPRPTPAPVPALPAPFEASRRPKVVLLGMMTKIPVAGVVWQTMHYLVGLERMGVEAYYVESHARTPSMFMEREDDDGSAKAAAFIADAMRRFGLERRWAFHALHEDGAVYGMSAEQLKRLYAEADLIVNLHGGTVPLPEHSATGRLIYVETDPVQLQIELYEKEQATIDFLEPHVAFFTFGENYGRPDCGLPVSDRFHFLPTRQPVVRDFWSGHDGPAMAFTTIGNWRQQWREVKFKGETYHWTKHLEFLKFVDLPRLTDQRFELGLSSYTPDDRQMLESKGWRIVNALDFSIDLDSYRSYIAGSRGEFTVAKDQNVRLRSGWFSDRSATYLAAGRPVITQDTGFGNSYPTGEGLFAFRTIDDVVAAVTEINGDYERHCRAARAIAAEYFDHEVVLGAILDELGVPHARRSAAPAPARPPRAWPADLRLDVVRKRPTTLQPATVSAVLEAPLPTLSTQLPTTAPAVSVVVVTHDNLVFTRLCLESLLANTERSDVEVIIVDNASTDMTPGYLDQLAESPRVRVLRNSANVGFAPAVNQGLAKARGDVLVLLNNDTMVAPGWLDALERHLREPSIGMVGPLTNAAPNEARIDVPYTTYGEYLQFAAERSASRAGQAFDIGMLTMFCVALRREVYERVGGLDEQFEVGMFEDDDFSRRVRTAGLRVVCADDVVVHHFGEASLGKLVPTGEHARVFNANKQRFERKWNTHWHSHDGRSAAGYVDEIDAVRAAITANVPAGATVLVVSKGDDQLLDVPGRTLRHFPCDGAGSYSGWYHESLQDVLDHIDREVARGATHIVFPPAASWWFEFYEGLDLLLRSTFVETDRDGVRIFATRQPVSVNGTGP